MASLKYIVAENLKKLRSSLQLTQNDFAKKCQMQQRAYGRLENAENWQHLESLEKIARANDLQVWQLLIPDFDPNNPALLRQASAKEMAFYEKIKAATKEFQSPQ